MTILQGPGVKGHQEIKRNQLDPTNLMVESKIRAYDVRRADIVIKAKHEASNTELKTRSIEYKVECFPLYP